MLSGKQILIINGTSAIARAITAKCKDWGADVVIGVRDNSHLTESIDFKIYNILSSYESIEEFAKNDCPQLDGMAVSIGKVDLRPLSNVNPKWLMEQLDSHINIIVYIVSALYRYKRFNPRSSIVFISSINGTSIASVGSTVYGMLKSAVAGFSKEIAKEFSGRRIRSNTICAGAVKTDFLQESFSEQQIDNMRKMNLTHELVTLEDIANATVFLLSDLSKSITGTNIIVDGGYCVNQ